LEGGKSTRKNLEEKWKREKKVQAKKYVYRHANLNTVFAETKRPQPKSFLLVVSGKRKLTIDWERLKRGKAGETSRLRGSFIKAKGLRTVVSAGGRKDSLFCHLELRRRLEMFPSHSRQERRRKEPYRKREGEKGRRRLRPLPWIGLRKRNITKP